MSRSGLTLLPKPLPADEIAVGQFLANPLDPMHNTFFSTASPSDEDLSDFHIQMRYRDLFSLDPSGHFAASYGSKCDLGKVWRKQNLLSVQADQMIYRSLKEPGLAFDAICRDPEAREWITELAARKRPFYWVAGIKELRNAKFKHAQPSESGLVEMPIEPTTRVPMVVRRDSTMGEVEAQNSGVFGMDIRKVQARIGSPEEPHSLEDLDWSWNYFDIPGDGQLMIGLGEPVSGDELRQMAHWMERDAGSETSYDSASEEE